MKPTPPISISQVHKVTGISRTQIKRWCDLGYLTFTDEVRNGVLYRLITLAAVLKLAPTRTPKRWRATKAKADKRKKGTS